MRPLPHLNDVFSLVVQQEHQLFGEIPESKVLATFGRGNNSDNFGGRGFGRGSNFSKGYGRSSNSGKMCTYCGRTGHTVDVCYKKHGYPPNYKFKNQGQINSVMAEVTDTDHVADQEGSCHDEGQEIPNFGFTAEQCHNLLALLQQYQSQPTLHTSN